LDVRRRARECVGFLRLVLYANGHRSVPRTRIRPKTLSPRRFEAHGPSFLRRYPWRAKQLEYEWRGETGPGWCCVLPDPATGACVDASRRYALLPLLRRPAPPGGLPLLPSNKCKRSLPWRSLAPSRAGSLRWQRGESIVVPLCCFSCIFFTYENDG
jgi:hypothetical protein